MTENSEKFVAVGRCEGINKLMSVLVKEKRLSVEEAILLRGRFTVRSYCSHCTRRCCVSSFNVAIEELVKPSFDGDILDFAMQKYPGLIPVEVIFELRTTMKKAQRKMDAMDTEVILLSEDEEDKDVDNGECSPISTYLKLSDMFTEALRRFGELKKVLGVQRIGELVEQYQKN